MNKTISASIRGALFHFEEGAYKKLEDYLNEVRDYFSKYDEHDEIIKDIESRIAEMLIEKRKNESDVITGVQIGEVVAAMGTVKDFDEFEKTDETSSVNINTKEIKKLYRDSDSALLGGVASGVAHYFEVDALGVRILFILSIFVLQWFSLVLYALLWLTIPVAKTTEEKAAMHGGGVPTLKTIRERANRATESVRSTRNSGAVRTAAHDVYEKSRSLFLILVRAGFVISGVALVLGAFALAAIGTFAGLMLAFGNFPDYLYLPLFEVAYGSVEYFVVLVSGYLAGLIPLLLVMAVGMAFIQKKFWLKGSDVLGLAMLWIIAVVVGLGVFFVTAPAYESLL